MARKRARTYAAAISWWIVRIVFAVLLAFPFYWMVITTFKRTSDLYNLQNNPFIFNDPPTLEHLKLLFNETLFLRWIGNTAFAGVIVVIITLLFAVPAAYALARLTGGWGAQLGIGIFLTYLIPPTLLFIPLSKMDAAMVDGLTRWGAFVKLMIPMSMSGVLTVVIFAFTLVTQEFVYALTFISTAAHQTVGVGVPTFLVRGDVYYWGSLMAACVITSIPIGILYNVFLDRFIEGFT